MTKNAESLAVMPQQQALQSRPSPTSFAPTTFEQAIKFAEYIAGSDLAPKDFKGKPGNVLVALQMGAEVGLAPMQAIQNIAVINGRPSLWGDSALAIVQGHPAYEWHKEYWEGDDKNLTAVFEIKRKGQETHVSKFSVQDAASANLLGKDGPWKTYKKRMLQMRARGFGMRDKFADALRGIITAEEAMDMPPIIGEPGLVETQKPKVERELGKLEASKEANRGHGKEGMEQPEAKAEASAPEPPAKEPGSGRRDDSLEAVTLLRKLTNKETKGKRPYQVLEFDNGKQGTENGIVEVINFHKSLVIPLAEALNKPCKILFHADPKNPDRILLDDVIEIAGQKWEKGKKSLEPQLVTGIAPSAAQLGFEVEKEPE